MRRLSSLLIVLAGSLAVLPAAADEWGTLHGRFLYDGKPPRVRKYIVSRDTEFCDKHTIHDESLIVGPKRGIANVVVYVATPDLRIHPDLERDLPPTVMLDNVGCRFEPHVLWLWVGRQSLTMHNSDRVSHNVNLQPIGDRPVNPLLTADQSFEHNLTRAQNVPVPVVCNLHPWMKGYVLPRDNPYVAISDETGVIRLDKLPTGELTFYAWHERVGYLEVRGDEPGPFTVSIDAGVNDLGDIKLAPERFRKRRRGKPVSAQRPAELSPRAVPSRG